MVELLTYSLEFRGDVSRNAVVVRASAPSCTHDTRLGGDGIAARFHFDDGAEEAILEARLLFNGDEAFSVNATRVPWPAPRTSISATGAPSSKLSAVRASSWARPAASRATSS
jgi:hypothetical protein